jgi:hypothetical protein
MNELSDLRGKHVALVFWNGDHQTTVDGILTQCSCGEYKVRTGVVGIVFFPKAVQECTGKGTIILKREVEAFTWR